SPGGCRERSGDVLGAGEQGQMTQNDETVETVVYQSQQAAKQLCKCLHRSLPLTLLRQQNHRTKDRWRSKFQISFGRSSEREIARSDLARHDVAPRVRPGSAELSEEG